jgi:ureidoglycolate lyase
MTETAITALRAQPLCAERFAPYGEVLAATEDGVAAGDLDAALDLSRGRPRFYLMQLRDKAPRFDRITRHRAVTQCLASVGGAPWWLAVAPPLDVEDPAATPDLDRLAAFEVPGDVAVLLARGTWHAGPYFEAPAMSFFNLELADTNQVDHHCVELGRWYSIEP